MSWFYVDDGLVLHEKLARLPLRMRTRAMGLWLLAGAWCRGALTGGHVPSGQVALLGGTRAEADALVKATFWERTENGYYFHDWPDWQETVEELERKRERERLKKAAWRKHRAGRGVAGPQTGLQTALSPGESPGESTAQSRPGPARVHRLVPGVSTTRSRDLPSPVPDPVKNSDHVAFSPVFSRAVDTAGNAENATRNFPNPGEHESACLADELPFVLREYFPVPLGSSMFTHVATLAQWLEDHHPADPLSACRQLAATFAADPWVREHGYPLADLANRPERYAGSPGNMLEAKRAAARAALLANDVDRWRSLQNEINALERGNHGAG